jgi:hypothetical protein
MAKAPFRTLSVHLPVLTERSELHGIDMAPLDRETKRLQSSRKDDSLASAGAEVYIDIHDQ